MKKKLAIGCLIFLQASLFAEKAITLKWREAYSRFNKKSVRQIYPGSCLSSQIEADFELHDYLGLFLNLDYLHKTGNSVVLMNKTTLDMGTISFGLKFTSHKYDKIMPYLGLGVSEALVHTHDRYKYVKKITNRLSTGLAAKSGCEFLVNKYFVIDIFADYFYQPMHIYYRPDLNQKTQDVGSLKVGAGLGARF